MREGERVMRKKQMTIIQITFYKREKKNKLFFPKIESKKVKKKDIKKFSGNIHPQLL